MLTSTICAFRLARRVPRRGGLAARLAPAVPVVLEAVEVALLELLVDGHDLPLVGFVVPVAVVGVGAVTNMG